MTIILCLIAILSIFQIGLIVDYYLLNKRVLRFNPPLFWGLGMGTLALIQMFFGLFKLPFNYQIALTILILSFSLSLVDQNLRSKFLKIKLSPNRLNIFFLLIFLLTFLLIFLMTFSHIIWGHDAYSFWLSKSNAFFQDNGITSQNLNRYWPQDYPILWPLVATWFYQVTQTSDGFWVRLIPFVTYLNLFVGFFQILKKDQFISYLWLVIFSLTPFFWGNVAFVEYGGNADLTVSLYLFLGIIFLLKKDLILTPLFLGLAILTKDDAIPALIAFILICPFLSKFSKLQLYSLIIALTFLLLDIFWKYYFNLQSRYLTRDLSTLFIQRPFFKNIFYTLQAYREEIRQTYKWGISWWIILFTFFINFKKLIRNKWLLFSFLIIFIQLISYLWIYYITPEDPATQIATSLFRLFLQLYPSLFVIAYQISTNTQNS